MSAGRGVRSSWLEHKLDELMHDIKAYAEAHSEAWWIYSTDIEMQYAEGDYVQLWDELEWMRGNVKNPAFRNMLTEALELIKAINIEYE
ncbi:MAG TPA: hypothetical protein VMR46_00090 [Candidatus Paceibacterota bacterium]|jgi:hypothetical protein|nr:hypothetical protein [Candidatus Paceibacterota bacterium]